MNKRTYTADETSWDVIFDIVGKEIHTVDNDKDKEEVVLAYKNLTEIKSKTNNRTEDDDIRRIIDWYYDAELENLEEYDEDDRPDDHIFYTLQNLRDSLNAR